MRIETCLSTRFEAQSLDARCTWYLLFSFHWIITLEEPRSSGNWNAANPPRRFFNVRILRQYSGVAHRAINRQEDTPVGERLRPTLKDEFQTWLLFLPADFVL